jgi:cytoskeletal protein RodZ
MDADTESYDMPGQAARLARAVLPWLALFALTGVLWNIGTGFVTAQHSANLAAQASAAASSTASAAATSSAVATGTAYVAKVQNDVPLTARPDAKSEKIATARTGATLTVLETQTAWMRVKDAAGHIGWIPNDIHYVTLQKK